MEWLAVFYYFATINNVFKTEKYSKKTKIILFFSSALICISGFIPKAYFPLNAILNIVICSIIPILLLKVKILKGIIDGLLYILFAFISEFIPVLLIEMFTNNDINEYMASNEGQILFLILYFAIFFVIISLIRILLSKKSKLHNMNKFLKSKQFIGFVIITLVTMIPEIILIVYNKYYYSFGFLLMNLIQIIIISLYMLYSTYTYLEKEKLKELNIELKTDNNSMSSLIDGVRSMKHDFNNIFQAVHGYVAIGDYERLNSYVKNIMDECNILNSLTMLSTSTFDDPGIYGIVGAKHHSATQAGILFDLDVTSKISDLHFPIDQLYRIFGILLDNAIEATNKAKEKYIKLEIHFNKKKNAQVIKIYNTYDTNINIDLEKIYEKGYSSKEVKSGIGLWEVKKFIDGHKKSQIFATIEGNMFVQNIIIED